MSDLNDIFRYLFGRNKQKIRATDEQAQDTAEQLAEINADLLETEARLDRLEMLARREE